MCLWRQCNKDPSAALGMTLLGERIDSQGWCATFLEDGNLVSQPSPLGEGARRGGKGRHGMKDSRDKISRSLLGLVLLSLLSFGSGFRVQGLGGGFAAFFYWAMPQSAFLVTSHSYDTREGIISHAWCQSLRLSPHLFWLGLFTHRAFSSVQDDDTGERKGFHLGDMLRVLELAVLYYDTSSPLL